MTATAARANDFRATEFDVASRLKREFPALRDPLPLADPPRWVRRREARRYRALLRNSNAKAHAKFWGRQWQQLARSAPVIRQPAREGLLCIELVGRCLEPLIPVGARCWFDPSMRAQHGDFVMFRMDDELLEYLANDPHALGANGGPPKSNIMIKRLMWMDRYYLVAKDSGGPIGQEPPHRHRVLGVLRDFEIDGECSDPPQAHGAYMTVIPRGADLSLDEATNRRAGDFMQRHEQQLDRVMRRFPPTFRNAAPPAPVRRVVPNSDPRELFAPVEQQVRDGSFSLRCPAESPEALIGPFIGQGACLEPLMPEGSTLLRWYDPHLPADDGDVVLTALDWKALYRAVEAARKNNPGWIAMYSEQPGPFAVKILRHIEGKHMLLANTSSVWLRGPGKHGFYLNRILGTLRYILIDGKPAYGSGPNDCGWSEIAAALGDDRSNLPVESSINIGEASGQVDTSRIESGAVTTLGAATLTSAGPLVGATEWISVIVPALTVDFSMLITVTFDYWLSANPLNTLLDLLIREDDQNGAFVITSEDYRAEKADGESNRRRVTLTLDFDGSASQIYYVAARGHGGSSPAWNFENAHLRVEAVKR